MLLLPPLSDQHSDLRCVLCMAHSLNVAVRSCGMFNMAVYHSSSLSSELSSSTCCDSPYAWMCKMMPVAPSVQQLPTTVAQGVGGMAHFGSRAGKVTAVWLAIEYFCVCDHAGMLEWK